jgi:adenylate kinase
MNLVLIGPQGSGKGTQADLICPQYGLVKLSTGDLFRAAIAAESELGLQVKELLDRGELVPDGVTLAVVKARLEEIRASGANGALFDGFPRTGGQAQGLDQILADQGEQVDLVVNIEVPKDVLVTRLAGRRVCTDCGVAYHVEFNPPAQEGRCDRCGGPLVQRSDDTPEAISRRLAIYEDQTAPLLSYYRDRGLVVSVDGNRGVQAVFDDIVETINQTASAAKA